MTDEPVPHSGLKSIGAVLAGILGVVILSLGTDIVMHASGIFPPWFQPMSTPLWLLATAYRIVYGIAGGYITARLAPLWSNASRGNTWRDWSGYEHCRRSRHDK